MNTTPPDGEWSPAGEREPDAGLEDGEPPPRPWSRGRQDLAALLWASFLTAAAGTMLFFAFVDPAEMLAAMSPDPEGSRMTGYGLGFFFFWLLALAAGALAVFLVRTARRNNGNGNGNGGGHGTHGPGSR